MNVVNEIPELKKAIGQYKKTPARTGFVPTMGALHDGHLSLVEQSKSQCDHTVVSIFVNPTQFSQNEDLDKYPRSLEKDFELLRNRDVDLVFVPDKQSIYPPGFTTEIEPPAVSSVLEGQHRPEHFKGVATVVLKLFNLVQADVAYFGQKDYQQALVIKRMVADLNVNIEVKTCPIIREMSGLAMSSRNRYLDSTQRQIANGIYQALLLAKKLIEQGETDGRAVTAEMNQFLIDYGIEKIDYAVLVEPQTLEIVEKVQLPVVALIAAFVGNTRLIDNLVIE